MKLYEFLSSTVDPDISFISEEELYEMANIVQKYSGIRHAMYISTVDNVQKRHGPRIKVPNVGDTFSPTDNFVITISRNPQVIGKPKNIIC